MTANFGPGEAPAFTWQRYQLHPWQTNGWSRCAYAARHHDGWLVARRYKSTAWRVLFYPFAGSVLSWKLAEAASLADAQAEAQMVIGNLEATT